MPPKRKNKKKKSSQNKSELTRLGAALRMLGGLGGAAVGGLVGQPGVGQNMGTSLGASVSRWLGSGDYTVSSNSLTKLSPNGTIPAMHSDNQTVVVRHKEYLGPVRGSTAFTVSPGYVLNPGNRSTFPWLCDIASRYSEYRFRGVIFHYVSTSGSVASSTNPAIGTVMMQTSYRASEAAPSSKMEMLNEYWACASAPNTSFCHPIECDPKENPFSIHYVRSSNTPVDSRLMYDMGTVWVATEGMPAHNNIVGDLWVTYEVELRKPVLVSDAVRGLAFVNGSMSVAPTPSVLFAGDFAGVARMEFTCAERAIILSDVVGDLTVCLMIEGNFTAAPTAPAVTTTGCTLVPLNARRQAYFTTVSTSTALSLLTHVVRVRVATPSDLATLAYQAWTWTGTATSITIVITPIGS